MIYLSGTPRPEMFAPLRPDLGLMLQPRIGNKIDLRQMVWAADNDCFSAGESFDLKVFYTYLEKMRGYQATCLFAVAPDVMLDAKATIRRSLPVFSDLRALGYNPALVAQDGLLPTMAPWDEFDWLFIGGSTTFKLSEQARELSLEAISRGKRVHMGRVNSYSRMQIAQSFGCTSVDGTYIRYGPTLLLPKLRAWLDRINGEVRE